MSYSEDKSSGLRFFTVPVLILSIVTFAGVWIFSTYVMQATRFGSGFIQPWEFFLKNLFNFIFSLGLDPFERFGTTGQAVFKSWVYGSSNWVPPTAYGLVSAFVAFFFFPFVLRNTTSTENAYGSARFATKSEEKRLRTKHLNALIVGSVDGTLRKNQTYGYDGNRHLLSLAPTRSGKGTCLIIPNLIHADRSILVVDPKGENARITARHRSSFGPVHVIDPFGISGEECSAYNPLQDLDPDNPDFADDAATLASALIVIDKNARDKHFEEGARSLMRGLLMFAAAEEPEQRRTLTTIREYLTWPKERFDGLLTLMAETETAYGAIKRAANTFLSKNDKEMRTIISTAQEQTLFLESPHLAKSLARSDVSFADLKRRRMTIYLVLPESRFESHGRWLRLLVARACQDIERTPRATPAPVADRKAKKKVYKEPPVLFLLDEFAAIGDMPAIRTAVGLMAGYDLQIWAFLQNWGQLEELYGTGAHTFAANAGVFHAFNVNDNLTARYVSDLSGDTTFSETTYGGTSTPSPDGRARPPVSRKLMTPEEVMHKVSDKHIFLKYSGISPIIAKKAPYFEDKRVKSRTRA